MIRAKPINDRLFTAITTRDVAALRKIKPTSRPRYCKDAGGKVHRVAHLLLVHFDAAIATEITRRGFVFEAADLTSAPLHKVSGPALAWFDRNLFAGPLPAFEAELLLARNALSLDQDVLRFLLARAGEIDTTKSIIRKNFEIAMAAAHADDPAMLSTWLQNAKGAITKPDDFEVYLHAATHSQMQKLCAALRHPETTKDWTAMVQSMPMIASLREAASSRPLAILAPGLLSTGAPAVIGFIAQDDQDIVREAMKCENIAGFAENSRAEDLVKLLRWLRAQRANGHGPTWNIAETITANRTSLPKNVLHALAWFPEDILGKTPNPMRNMDAEEAAQLSALLLRQPKEADVSSPLSPRSRM